jgi:hypothetical protein
MGWTRTVIGVAASLVGFGTGPATSDETAAEAEGVRAAWPGLESEGFAASGPSFYVWDEDAGQVRRWAAELARPLAPSFQGTGSVEPGGSDQPVA